MDPKSQSSLSPNCEAVENSSFRLTTLEAMGRAELGKLSDEEEGLDRVDAGPKVEVVSGGEALGIDPDTDVLSVHALEQLGAKGPQVIDLILARRPRRVLHIEPILDFYDRANPFDDIGARYHLARGYLQGLVGSLDEHATAGRIEITSRGRVRLGNLYHEAYSFISWRPV